MQSAHESVRSYRQSCELTAKDVPLLRAEAAAEVRSWGLEDIADDVASVVSELLTNVLEHAARRCVVVVRPYRTGVVVSVADKSPVLPGPRVADDDAETGRGLMLVEALASSVKLVPAKSGKVIHCLLGAEVVELRSDRCFRCRAALPDEVPPGVMNLRIISGNGRETYVLYCNTCTEAVVAERQGTSARKREASPCALSM
ncbi:ATP-binding protein [Streptomyces sp. BH105]|uniref:ATP-binding protein n=1 Tax=Streptomyces sp. BH105 TaxID=3410408 RepID=UPI003CF9B437